MPSFSIPFINYLYAEEPMDVVEIIHGDNPNWTVIWLHGLGADANDFVPIVPELKLPEAVSVRFLFPNAPVRPITINGGMQMRGWYDIKSLDLDNRADKAGVLESEQLVNRLIEQQIDQGIAEENIILAGFSQGGAIALHCGLSGKYNLAGIIALSTYIPLSESISNKLNPNNYSPPVFMAHGEFDPVVPIELGLKGKNLLEELGFGVQWQTYPMPHSVTGEEILAIGQWLDTRFSRN